MANGSWVIQDDIEWRWPNFKPEELCDKHTGELKCSTDMLDKLQWVRIHLGVPMYITSGYRNEDRDARLGGGGEHPEGHAVDVSVDMEHVLRMIGLAIEAGFTRIGVNQKGRFQDRFVHLGDSRSMPSPRVWSY